MKTGRLDIRKATLADTNALTLCIDAAYAHHMQRISDMPQVSDGLADDIINNQVWVAKEDDEIIAGLVLVPLGEYLKLANLAVHPNYSNKGLGRKLTELSEREARRQGYKKMRLNTHVEIPENVQFYKHLGWEEVLRSGSTVSMRKHLNII